MEQNTVNTTYIYSSVPCQRFQEYQNIVARFHTPFLDRGYK